MTCCAMLVTAIFMGRGRVRRAGGGSKGNDEAVDQQAAEERAVSVIANLMMVPAPSPPLATQFTSSLTLSRRGAAPAAWLY